MTVKEIFRNFPIHRKKILADHRNSSWKPKLCFCEQTKQLKTLPPGGKILLLFPSQAIPSYTPTSPINAIQSTS